MACQFSVDGKFFAQISSEGKLKIWNTLSNSLEQEFTPDLQLTSSCTCLHFVETANKAVSPRKKKRKESQGDQNAVIALGTSSGRLLIYSLTKADLDYMIDGTVNQPINCLSTNSDGLIYSGIDSCIVIWNLGKKDVSSKWSGGNNDKINAILAIPNSNHLLTASKTIKLWDTNSKEVLKSYTGHSSHVTLLKYLSPVDRKADPYVISGSKGDRLLNCWSLSQDNDGKSAIASFLMEDIVNNLSVHTDRDKTLHLTAAVRSGVLHVYQHTLNGQKCSKPVKPKTTIQVVSDSKGETPVTPIQITSAIHKDAQTLCIGYGSSILLRFENVQISSYQKLQCLMREDLHKVKVSKEKQVSKVVTPIVGNDVHYLSAQSSIVVPTKRKNDGQQEIPMEQRLENLMVNEKDSNAKVPKANNVAQLLVQGLHSKDKNILKAVLFKKDEQLIKNTVNRLPINAIIPLFEELTKMIQGKTLARRISLTWFKHLMLVHSGLLLANPDLPKFFAEAMGSIEAGIALQAPRNRLMGRLELLVSQVSQASNPEAQDNNEAALVFNDKGSSDSENEVMEFEVHSYSENEWEEASSDGDNNENEQGDGSDNDDEEDSDEAMSS